MVQPREGNSINNIKEEEQVEMIRQKLADDAQPTHSFIRKSSSLEVLSVDKRDNDENIIDISEEIKDAPAHEAHHPKSLLNDDDHNIFEQDVNVELHTSEKDPANIAEGSFRNSSPEQQQMLPEEDSTTPASIDDVSQTQETQTKQERDAVRRIKSESDSRNTISTQAKPLKIRVGVCCIQKKLNSRPMREILKFLDRNEEIEICRFNDVMLLQLPIEEWLRCDVLIGFYSTGFPLQKAIDYVRKYKPVMINSLDVQHELWDRTKVLDKLRRIGVPVAKSFAVYRGEATEFTQQTIENQAINTKDKGEFYIQKAQDLKNKKSLPRHGLNSSTRSTESLHKLNGGGGNGSDDKKLSTTEVTPQKRSSEGSVNATDFVEEQKDTDVQAQRLVKQHSVVSQDNSGSVTTQSQFAPKENKKKHKKINSDLLFEDVEADVQEYDDCIVIRGNILKKPFIEKPINAEDHEIMIHYSNDSPCGSGYSVLFRKTQSTCSQFFPALHESTIRTDGSYLYEEFLPTDGFDIKVYTVGEDYAHAEARRCPSIDGKVQRDESTGKEVRYPVNLNHEEKEMARIICREFQQDICGFDMLRCGGKTYVCDVNGFSFVKTSFKYYEDCAMQLRRIILRKLNLSLEQMNELIFETSSQKSGEQSRPFRPQKVKQVSNQKKWELRSVVAVFRHADRTPKQKMKMKVKHPNFLKFFNKGTKDIKIKKPKEMQEILKITIEIIKQKLQAKASKNVEDERLELEKLVQLKYVLEKDKFEGLNRKIQMKCLKCEILPDKTDSDGKPLKIVTEALFILKFGGELTHAGCNQADAFGTDFREKMYVEDPDAPRAKGGLLRLHSTYRHDLKVYTSDEGRCQKTAASFLKGLLQIEGALAPILAIMVINDKTTKKMLDECTPAQDCLDLIKVKLNQMMHYDGDDSADEFVRRFGEKPPDLIGEIFSQIGNPLNRLKRLADLVDQIINQLEDKLIDGGTDCLILESYRQLPLSFDKIFHNSTNPRTSMGPDDLDATSMIQIRKLDSCEDQKSRARSQSPNQNERRNMDSKVPQITKTQIDQEKNDKFFVQGIEMSPEDINSGGQEDSKSDKRNDEMNNFNSAKQQFLRRMEANKHNRLSPDLKRYKKEPRADQIIKELQQEEDNVSINSYRVDHNQTVGISVNERLNGEEVVCDGQPILYQLKRWKKIANDFQKKDGTFDISKIPEICDNIKFDNLHSPELINEMRLNLLETAQELCRIIVPMEYGVSLDDKIEVGLKIITPLLKKIQNDILWWKQDSMRMNENTKKEFGEERQWEKSGLDEAGLGGGVKSFWRHIRTRLYFTSASHMYTLLHTLKLGVDSILIDGEDLETKKQLDGILRLDFMSSFVFRLFEDLDCEENDSGRFKLEIMVNRGATVNRDMIQDVSHHTVPILHENFVDINKRLTIEQLETFFQHLLTMQETDFQPQSTTAPPTNQSNDIDLQKESEIINKVCCQEETKVNGNGPEEESKTKLSQQQ